MSRAASLALALVLALVACSTKKESPMSRIDAVHEGLLSGDDDRAIKPVLGVPRCAEGAKNPKEECLDALATTLGSKVGFRSDPLDQASCATAAVVLVRQRGGDLLPDADLFLAQLKSGKGTGVDALRIAVADGMSGGSMVVGARFETEKELAALVGVVARTVPGACRTYGAIGRGVEVAKVAPEVHPDHAACVQKDLGRREGPGPRYASGMFRAAEGAAAIWRETERALRVGLPNASPRTREHVSPRLATIEAATQRLSIKKVDSPQTPADVLNTLSDVHADAGITLFKTDGGAKR